MLTALLLALGVRGQTTGTPPQRMTYQGYLTDGAGVALGLDAPRTVNVVFRIYNAATGGEAVWAEQQAVVVDRGYFSVQLGEGLPVAGVTNDPGGLSFAFTGAGASERHVGMTLVGFDAGGLDAELKPRVRLVSAPYAYLAMAASGLANVPGVASVTFGTNLVSVPGSLAASSVRAASMAVGTLNVTNNLSFSGMAGGFVSATDMGMRFLGGRHGYANSVLNLSQPVNSGTFVSEPSAGYSIARTAVGEYTVTFDTPFATVPHVVATPLLPVAQHWMDSAWCEVVQSTDPSVACRQVTIRTIAHDTPRRTFLFYNGNTMGNVVVLYHNPLYPSRGTYGVAGLMDLLVPRNVITAVDLEFSFIVIGN